MPHPLSLEAQRETWLATVQRIMPDDCWNWPWCKTPAGYGQIRVDGRNDYAHRVYYKRLRGAIPQGHQIDHLCRNRACCNPAHLEAVTERENQRRGLGWSGINARKTHCPRGHEYTTENTDGRPSRYGRWCKACKRLSDKAYRTRKRDQAVSEARKRGER